MHRSLSRSLSRPLSRPRPRPRSPSSPRARWLSRPLSLALAFAAGCKDPEPTHTLPPPTGTTADLTATGASSALVPSVLQVDVADPPAGATAAWVAYGLEDDVADPTDLPLRTPDAAGFPVSVLGLKAGRRYTWQAFAVDAEGATHASAPAAFDVPAAPPALLPLTLEVAEDDASVAYVAMGVIRTDLESFLAIADRDGDWVWWVSAGETVLTTPELGRDGRSMAWSQYDFGRFLDVGNLARVALDGRSRVDTRLKLGHHDFVQHDDGTIAFLSAVFADVDIGGGDTARMASDAILVGPEGMTDADAPAVVFDQFRDFPLQPEVTCSHIAAVTAKLGETGVNEWTHGNSLMYLPETGLYYLNDKFTDWLMAIDPATGAVQWTMNGRGGDFTQPGGAAVWTDVSHTSLWSHGHMSQIWDGGGMMFDNGDHHAPPLSRAIEFAWDEAAMTAEVVWEHPHPDGAFTTALGDVHRLPNDDVLITWASIGTVDEVTRDHRLVWRVRTSGDQQVGRIVPLADLYAP